MNRHSFFILCVLLGLLSASAADQVELRGKVVDAETDEPIIGCIVKCKGAFTSTDKEGRFKIIPKAGAHGIRHWGSSRCEHKSYSPLGLGKSEHVYMDELLGICFC